jgi:calcium/calmodulin-dependent protein kinase I
MRCLNHKNTLKLYEVYETEHSLYLVVDLLSGGELISRIQSNIKDTSFLDIAFLIKNLLEAVGHMHKKGIMHRDIKPENLLLQNTSNIYDIVLADFGLATKIKQPVEEILFKRCGTPGFVAPEILAYKDDNSEFYNEKCDIFSIGALFYLL